MSSSRRRLAGRAGWTIADQLLSSMSNLVLSMVVAHSLDRFSFGAFSIAFLIFGVALALERAVVGQPLQIQHSGDNPREFRRHVRQGFSTALVIGLAFSVGCAVAGLLLKGSLGEALLALAVFMPFLVLQDACRMAWFAVSNAKEATILDLAWNVALALALVVLELRDSATLTGFMLAWGGSAALAALLGFQRLGVLPSFRGSWTWIRDRRRLCGYLIAEYVIGLGAVQLSILVAGVLTSATEVGSLRGAQVMLGPLAILGAAAFSFAIPELTRRSGMTPATRLRAGALTSGLLGVAAVIYLALALAVPDSIGAQLFGDTWSGARAVLLPLGLASAASAMGSGAGIVLYSLSRADLTFRLHATKLPFLLVSVGIGSARAGALGAAVALLACEAAMQPAWIWTAIRAANGPRPGRKQRGRHAADTTGGQTRLAPPEALGHGSSGV